ncbi:PLD nuclease N-terminal domain-containing protein [Paramicrobacterium agarici]|uniref:PLD nuclease N-terminal domain-containing protein n=1 Tax=Paramicrobacterium agarici TaxID=630514 RepID=UPI0011532795
MRRVRSAPESRSASSCHQLCLRVRAARTTSLSSSAKALWILVVIAAPVVGAVAWFASADWRRASKPRDVSRVNQ